MAAKRTKRPTSRAADKAKRQKIILIAGCVVLAGVLAIEGPTTLKLLNAKPPANEAHAQTTTTATTAEAAPAAPASTAPATTTAVPAPAPLPSTSQAGGVVAGGIGIADTTVQPTPADGQLISFDRFRTKDPFVPQVQAACAPDSAGAAACTSTTPTTQTPPKTTTSTQTSTTPSPASTTPTPTITPTPTPGVTPPPTTPAQPPAKPSSATIAVNGTAASVAVKGSFPESDPTFRLVSVTSRAAKIGLVGGSYSSGAPTITLQLGKTVTLMNTADGTRYKLKLVSVP